MKIKVSNYEIQSDVAREAFLTFDFEDIVKKLDLKQDNEYLYVKFINNEYRLGKKSSEIQRIEENSTYIDAGFYSEVRRGEWEVLRCSHWTIPLDREHSSRYAMKVVLLPLQEGEYNIEKGIRTQEEITSYIRITDSLNKVEYCPLKKPFKVYVDSVRYHESSMMPYIEGKMEGTLYNRYDVNDSIVVKDAIFGIH